MVPCSRVLLCEWFITLCFPRMLADFWTLFLIFLTKGCAFGVVSTGELSLSELESESTELGELSFATSKSAGSRIGSFSVSSEDFNSGESRGVELKLVKGLISQKLSHFKLEQSDSDVELVGSCVVVVVDDERFVDAEADDTNDCDRSSCQLVRALRMTFSPTCDWCHSAAAVRTSCVIGTRLRRCRLGNMATRNAAQSPEFETGLPSMLISCRFTAWIIPSSLQWKEIVFYQRELYLDVFQQMDLFTLGILKKTSMKTMMVKTKSKFHPEVFTHDWYNHSKVTNFSQIGIQKGCCLI